MLTKYMGPFDTNHLCWSDFNLFAIFLSRLYFYCYFIAERKTNRFFLECLPISSICSILFVFILNKIVLMQNCYWLASLRHFPTPVYIIFILNFNLIKHKVDQLFFTRTISTRNPHHKCFELPNKSSFSSLKILDINTYTNIRWLRSWDLMKVWIFGILISFK